MSSLISSVYNSRRTILAMLENRGFLTNDYAEFSSAEVAAMVSTNQLDMLVTNGSTKVYVSHMFAKELKPATLQDIIADLFENSSTLDKGDTLLIVTKSDPNESMVSALVHLWESDGIHVVVTTLKRTQFLVLSHQLVPKHRLMTQEEKSLVAKKFNILNDSQWPQISRFDPVAVALLLRPGSTCEITRSSKTAITAPYYRICV